MNEEPPPPPESRPARRFVLSRPMRPAFALRPWLRRAVHVAMAVVVGIVCTVFAGIADVASHYAAVWFARWPWAALGVMPASLVVAVYVTRRWFPTAAGSGIPQVLAALETDDLAWRKRLLSVGVALAKIVLVLLALLAGAAVGREGPSVHVAAALMFALASIGALKFSRDTSSLILAGAGAGIASAFNTPLGGIVFVLEELSRHRAFRAHSQTLVAVIGAGLASVLLVGKYTYFGVVRTTLPDSSAWVAVAAAGLVGGVAGGAFARACTAVGDVLPTRIQVGLVAHPLRAAAVCGLLLAGLALVTHGATMGTGYGITKALVDGQTGVVGLEYAPARMAATYLAFLAGIPGGLFAPSLAVGAGIGSLLHAAMPTVPLGSLALLAMVGYLAAVTQSPITSFVITMEMTANQELLLPMMAVAVIAFGVSRALCPAPIYDALARSWRPPPQP
ncbi:MAG: chloride channel protein [Proteobacteria bacterium]|nr:chloride channel protein [Pseudomonadota bacterium]